MPGSLEEIDLPLTIKDAITVCRHTHQRYLWVDRLCIIQDDSEAEKAVQLEQMAVVYHQSVFTIVAVEGDDADAGLAGVTPARLLTERSLRSDDYFELAARTEQLLDSLSRSKWITRGWTFQEDNASSRLLFFTHSGCFLQRSVGAARVVDGQANSVTHRADIASLSMIAEYSGRTLTYSSDILRAISGILNATSGERTTLGMPWDDFDRAVLWSSTKERPLRAGTKKDVFPSWSWVSACERIAVEEEDDVYSFAYWATTNTSQKRVPQWVVMEAPRRRRLWTIMEGRMTAALAWIYGCVRGSVPGWLRLDCSKVELHKRIKENWEEDVSIYWCEAFRFAKENKLLHSICVQPLHGQLAVNTQKTSFTVDQIRQRSLNVVTGVGKFFFLIRAIDHRVAGSIYLDEYSTQELDHGPVEFLLLSAHNAAGTYMHPRIMMSVFRDLEDLDLATLFGCPCTLEAGGSTARHHITECPRHAEFNNSIPLHPHADTDCFQLQGDAKKAFLKHSADVSYINVHGELLHDYRHPPALNVMLITPHRKSSKGTTIYQRLGIGRIYLKRWIEALPKFETIVLE